MSQAAWIMDVLVGLAVVLITVGSMILMARRGFFEPGTNEESPEEREDLEESTGREDFRIPYRKRVKSWSGPYKIFVGALALLGVGVSIGTYQVLKTGSPVQQMMTREVRFGLVAIVGVAGGVRLKSWFDDQVAYLDVIYERDAQEPLIERVPYADGRVKRRNGRVTIPEIAGRLMGLFWRYRQRGEDRRLRSGEKPLDDIIQHQIPDHGVERPDGGGFIVTTREDGDQILSGEAVADVTYGSPNSLSDERATQIREEKRRMKAELKAVSATNSELQQEIKDMRKKIKNQEWKDRKELMEDLDRFSEYLSTLNVRLSDETGSSTDDETKETRNGHAEAKA